MSSNFFRQLLLFLVCISIGCTTQNRRIEQALQKEDCESAFAELASPSEGIKSPTTAKDIASSALAYTYVGTSYTVQFLWDVTGGIITFVGLCGPAMVAQGIAGTNPAYQPIAPADNGQAARTPYVLKCIDGNFKFLHAPQLGKTALAQTKNLRCPDLQSFYQKIKEISGCYEKKGDQKSKEQAFRIFESLREASGVFECLSEPDKENLSQQMVRLKVVKADLGNDP